MLPSAAPEYSVHTEWRWWYPMEVRSRFRSKLPPSSQAWPLLSTSNRGETAIVKCGNCPLCRESNRSRWIPRTKGSYSRRSIFSQFHGTHLRLCDLTLMESVIQKLYFSTWYYSNLIFLWLWIISCNSTYVIYPYSSGLIVCNSWCQWNIHNRYGYGSPFYWINFKGLQCIDK